ncbi:keratin-associated protein 5-1-like isoform X2 [Homarus americanus]|uniref:keratin-associated protein 5-1-like isoform X2 n=1 Tax=Homarus americanus TaxID=6706 RepID=UPI001C43E6D4|nr:keratin-associated protein 5-1-like isoform X2 [Homarus americanus]
MKTNILLMCLALSAVQVATAEGDEPEKAGEEAVVIPEETTLAAVDDRDEETRTLLCRKTLGATCAVSGGICVMKGGCGRKGRVLSLGNCQSCTCCPSVQSSCPWTDACQWKGGKCMKHCPWGMKSIPGICSYSSCSCCVPDNQCVTTNECFALKGKCVQSGSCVGGEIKSASCSGGSSCVCCAPKTQTPTCTTTTQKCLKQGGSCKTQCSSNQDVYPDACSEGGCKCCIPKGCWIKEKCTKRGGSCKASCGPGEEYVGNGCTGLNCACCKPARKERCTPSRECNDKYGKCKEWCEGKEKELVYGCTGGHHCKCCYVPY